MMQRNLVQQLTETLSSMHLGINAFLSGLADDEGRYHRVDTLVHEFCKLFGTSGVPEYCSGVISFPEFLEIKISTSNEQQKTYYSHCLKTRLHRQIGSRYFVPAANTCKVLYLRNAAIEVFKVYWQGCW